MVVQFKDGSIGIIDFESKYLLANFLKYFAYGSWLMDKYNKEGKAPKYRVIVIYTCDVKSAPKNVQLGSFACNTYQAFLSKIDGDAVLAAIKGKLESEVTLTDEDLMRLIILPLTKKGNREKQEMIDEVIETSQMVNDEERVSFILSAMMVSAGNFISDAQAEKIKEVLTMTAVGKLFEDEKVQYGEDCRVEGVKEGIKEGKAEGIKEGKAIGEASFCVRMVQKRMTLRSLTAEEACAELDIDPGYYIVAQALIASQPDQVAV